MSCLSATGAITYEKARQGFYTDLDTLYDTRLAVVEEVDMGLALHLLKTGWCSRLYDRVPGISQEHYDELYRQRDAQTLALANPTMASEAIRGWCRQANNAMMGTPHGGFCEVFVNVWPYRLNREQAREIVKTLTESLQGLARVSALNFDPKEITVHDARLYFSCMMMQNWHDWLEERSQRGELKRMPVPDVTLYAPRVFRGQVDAGQYEQIRDKDIFTTVEEQLKPIVGLEFIETDFFSSCITPEVASLLVAQTQSTA